ncbi:MAG: HAD hydrolase family protein [Burkholderiales bacterium]|nr:HAD hydrolase family protein [Burkholderiales bacterium]
MPSKVVSDKAKMIKVIATDVDGVLTDGSVFICDDHEEPFGKFNILDGFAVIMARECGIKTVVISGRKSLATEARCSKLGIDLAYTGVHDKQAKITEVANELGVSLDEIAYIGDDLIDLPVLSVVGLRFAPNNAVNDVKERVDHVSSINGGSGVLREVVELVLRAQNKYDSFLARYLA